MEKFNCDYFFDSDKNILKTKTKKKQIVLLNTGCEINEHTLKITTRSFSNYKKIPTFTISRGGEIFQHFNTNYHSEILDNFDFDKQAITIALENNGWLVFDEKNDYFFDWSEKRYNYDVIEKSWRNKKYWAAYTAEQYESLFSLCEYLCKENNINKNFIGHNVMVNKIINYRGIINRSNFSKYHYDLTPAFDFDELIKRLK